MKSERASPVMSPEHGISIAIQGINPGPAIERMDGNAKLYQLSLSSFLKYRDRGAKLAEALAACDYAGCARIVHGVKGMAAAIGAEELTNQAKILEQVCRQMQQEEATRLAPCFIAMLEQQCADVASWINSAHKRQLEIAR